MERIKPPCNEGFSTCQLSCSSSHLISSGHQLHLCALIKKTADFTTLLSKKPCVMFFSKFTLWSALSLRHVLFYIFQYGIQIFIWFLLVIQIFCLVFLLQGNWTHYWQWCCEKQMLFYIYVFHDFTSCTKLIYRQTLKQIGLPSLKTNSYHQIIQLSL